MTNKTGSVNYEFYQDKAGEWRWRSHHKTSGTQIGKSTEGFSSEQNAVLNAIKHGYSGDSHPDKDLSEELAKQSEREFKWEIYEDAAHNEEDHGDKGRWRWRFYRVMKDGTIIPEIIGASSEAYMTRESCVNNAEYYGFVE
jgi:uncharacterized protein YegP (UPF0339 family)